MLNLLNASITDFINYIGKRKIYAFGAGQVIRRFCEINKNLNFESIIFSFVDNDKNICGKDCLLNNINIPVISVDSLIKNINKNDILLISTVFYPEIFEQLDCINDLDGIDCFILPYITNKSTDPKLFDKINAAKEKSQQIPKKIHYFWFGNNEMSDKEKMCVESWYKLCPDYEIIKWDESNYDITKNKYMHQAYNAKKWGFVPDYARLDVMYENGGVYLDTDVELIKPIDDLLFHKAFAGFESNNYISTGLGFGAEKYSEIIRILREDYNNKEFIDGDGNLNLTPCPVYQSEFLEKQGFILNNTFQCINGLAVYPYEFFDALDLSIRDLPMNNTYSIHWYSNSWKEENQRPRQSHRIEFHNKYKFRIKEF